jgi:predicted PolB exonuclease-like 3'-5' exonuclease
MLRACVFFGVNMDLGNADIKYLVFDIESAPDGRLIKSVKYPKEDIDGETAIEKLQNEILESSGGTTNFIPVTFQYPISLCIAKVTDTFALKEIVSLDEPEFRAGEIAKQFWFGVETFYKNASLVTFNGRGFDLPLMELMAYRYGIQAKRHFTDKFGTRFRHGNKHIDLQEFLSNYTAIRMNGGLNLLSKVLGKPGKMETTGSEVYDLFLQNKKSQINDYCIHDVLDTYFVFLRTRVMLGELTIDREQQIVSETKEYLDSMKSKVTAYTEYLENWGDWEPWP